MNAYIHVYMCMNVYLCETIHTYMCIYKPVHVQLNYIYVQVHVYNTRNKMEILMSPGFHGKGPGSIPSVWPCTGWWAEHF